MPATPRDLTLALSQKATENVVTMMLLLMIMREVYINRSHLILLLLRANHNESLKCVYIPLGRMSHKAVGHFVAPAQTKISSIHAILRHEIHTNQRHEP